LNNKWSTIYTTVNFTSYSVTEVGALSAAGWVWSGRGQHKLVASGRGAHVYTCTCVHDNIPCRRLPK